MAFHVGVMDKQQVLDALAGGETWDEFTIDEPRFVEIAPDVASLTYTTVARPAGTDQPYAAAITSVYAKREGRWLLVLHHQTPLAGS